MSPIAPSRYRPEIVQVAARFGLDPLLLEAQVWVESGDQPWAWNPEPKYRYLWDVQHGRPFRALTALEQAMESPPPDFPCLEGDRDQEWWGQQASWGLLQVMGAVAREHGFLGSYLPQLCDPLLGLEAGARHVAQLLVWAHDNPWQALAAYNGGKAGNTTEPYRNESYVRAVRAQHNARLAAGGSIHA